MDFLLDDSPTLSLIVSWRDRDELGITLPHILGSLEHMRAEVLVINYGGNKARLASFIEPFGPRVRTVEVDNVEYFNKSCAHNHGAAAATGDIFFFCDCDIIIQPEVLPGIVAEMMRDSNTFATIAGVKETEHNSRRAKHVVSFGYTLRIKTADGRLLEIIDNEEDSDTGKRQAPGLLLVRRGHFQSIDGYNGRLIGWGWEDQDIISRLTLGLGLRRISLGEAIHVSHDDVARTAHYPPFSSRWESRDRMFRQALANYDEGDFSGTLSQDANLIKSR
jgi:predicted glycosyltransferase involved in capsule biosynthesis